YGNEVPILVGNNGDYIEFYGKGIDTIESDTQIYFLTTGTIVGKRISTRVVRRVGSLVPAKNYAQTAVRKERTQYNDTILNGDAENYWGRLISSTPTTYNFTLTGVDSVAPNSSITINLQAFSFAGSTVNLSLNGNALAAMTTDSQSPFSRTYSVPTSYLQEGTNGLQMTATSAAEFSYFDSLSVTYSRKFLADQNSVSFPTQLYRATQVKGFTSPNIRVFDLTNDNEPIQVTNVPVEQNGSQYFLNVPAGRPTFLFALENSAVLQSPSVIANNPSTLVSTTHN